MADPHDDALDRLEHRVAAVEAFLLVAALVTMLGLSLLQFALRKTLEVGFEWADITVRQSVLWLGFLGGARATYQGRHIAIDAVARFLSPERGAWLKVLTSLVAAGITLVLTYASVDFVMDERLDGTKFFGDLDIWPFQLAFPVAFITISFHFLVGAKQQWQVARGVRPPLKGEEQPADLDEEAES